VGGAMSLHPSLPPSSFPPSLLRRQHVEEDPALAPFSMFIRSLPPSFPPSLPPSFTGNTSRRIRRLNAASSPF